MTLICRDELVYSFNLRAELKNLVRDPSRKNNLVYGLHIL